MWATGPVAEVEAGFGVERAVVLQYPHDPPELRWTWQDGLEALVQVVHRHLVFEEYWRRTGRWPVEDAPHGHGRRPHPILHSSTRRTLKEIA